MRASSQTSAEKSQSSKPSKVVQLDEANLGKWRDIARDTAWKDFANKNASCAELLKLAEQVA